MIRDFLSRLLLSNGTSDKPLILMYHSVEPGEASPHSRWAVSSGRFKSHLDLLKEAGWVTVTISDLLIPANLPSKCVAITFDDGYANNLIAVEMLVQRRQRATWFISTGSLGGVPLWPGSYSSEDRLLTGAEIREMRALGMEIGSHTRTHHPLAKMSVEKLFYELKGSRDDLEHLLGEPVTSFAYPYGDFSKLTIDAVRCAGYKIACTTRDGWALEGNDPMLMSRVSVFNHDTAASLARKLVYAKNEVGWVSIAKFLIDSLKGKLKPARKNMY